MIHMDVDPQPLSSNRRRYVSIKRARSPEPLVPHDRPSKKVALAVGQLDAFPALDNIRGQLGDTSTGSSRHSSEDWVQQAGGLTIDSPVCTGSNFSEPEDTEGVPRDEDMMMEFTYNDPQDSTLQPERPRLPPLQTCGYTPFTSGNPDRLSHGLDQSLPSVTVDPTGPVPFQTALPPGCQHQHQRRSLVSGQNPIMGPVINIVPPTPMEFQVAHGCHHAGLLVGLNSSASSQNTLMPSSPKLMTPLTPKKQRFAMGPRADCDKCRLGIKGHFVHLD